VSSLVRASLKIKRLSSTVEKELTSDEPVLAGGTSCTTPATCGCYTVTQCVTGDVTSDNVIVLFGDSHALMWLPAVDYAATAAGYRVVLLFSIGCPVAELTNAWYVGFLHNPDCASWRSQAITAINTLAPQVVLLGERTARVVSEPHNVPIPSHTWQTALESTISKIKTPTTKVAVLEDIPFLTLTPTQCLASHSTNVQDCSISYPNKTYPGQQTAEQAAAKAKDVGFIKTVPWFCTTRCSPVVGTYISYSDQSHVSLMYSEYLSKVVQAAIKPLL
jgi:hypothetical protein